MKIVCTLAPGHKHTFLSAIAAAMPNAHMIMCVDDLPNINLKTKLQECAYTLDNISRKEMHMPNYFEDEVPAGMSPSYHHILSKQRKSKRSTRLMK